MVNSITDTQQYTICDVIYKIIQYITRNIGVFFKLSAPKINHQLVPKMYHVCVSLLFCCQVETGALESVMSHPSRTESRQVEVLNASSTLWYPRPITTHPTKPFPFHTLTGCHIVMWRALLYWRSVSLNTWPHFPTLCSASSIRAFWLVST